MSLSRIIYRNMGERSRNDSKTATSPKATPARRTPHKPGILEHRHSLQAAPHESGQFQEVSEAIFIVIV